MRRFYARHSILQATVLIALSPIALSGCGSPAELSSADKRGSPAASGTAINPQAPSSLAGRGATPEPGDVGPLPDLEPCPGINSDIRRPAGSNCLGILPQQCGADRVATILGEIETPALRISVARRSGHENIRWIAPGDAVIENLDPDRLNIQMDARRRIVKVDCY